ncbi:MAG: hypothetical protein JWP57_3751 [Spirosoma sp.]|nr:hypothetical protein [Spirosoma sp.]
MAITPSLQGFISNVIIRIQQDAEALGLAGGGSYASGELDAYSDLDLVLVTTQSIAPELEKMRAYASGLGTVLASFRGDHVGEPRLLIALYDAPLLHVDIKFLTPSEFYERVENPVILWERNGALSAIMEQSDAHYPAFDFQWAEDRFWIWVHYAALKIGRGEYFEAMDFLAFVRNAILGPLLHLKNKGLPRGVRRIETVAGPDDINRLRITVAAPNRKELMVSLKEVVRLYEDLRKDVAPATLVKNSEAQSAVMTYLAAL